MQAHARNLPLPVISRKPELQNNPPRRLRRHLKRLRHHPGRHQRFRHHQLDQLRQF